MKEGGREVGGVGRGGPEYPKITADDELQNEGSRVCLETPP